MENKFNYQIITEKDENGRHIPDYDKLIANASCEEEAAEWRSAKEHKYHPTFNLIVCMKMTCGHWEIFQSIVNYCHDLDDELEMLYRLSLKSKCTHCICHW